MSLATATVVFQGNNSTPARRYYVCQEASVHRPEIDYPSNSFLGLPQETRNLIWQAISDDLHESPHWIWYARPKTGYDGLTLVCRQIWHEIALFWRRAIVPHNRMSGFLTQPFSQSGVFQFRTVSLEVSFTMNPAFFKSLAVMLKHLNPYIKDLRLSFTGLDADRRLQFVHGCANTAMPPGIPPQMLRVSVQDFHARLPLLQAIGNLSNLHSLTLWNFNIPVLQPHIIRSKPYLTKLCVVMDPRVSLAWPYTLAHFGGPEKKGANDFPPVKELQLTTNAAITSSQVVSKLAPTLKHLTWIMPDVLRQRHNPNMYLYQHSGIVFRQMRWNNKDLHTLRICIEGSIHDTVQAHSELTSAFKEHTPHLVQLKNLELHMHFITFWMNREILSAIPPNLERLYLSDTFISVEEYISFLENLLQSSESPLPTGAEFQRTHSPHCTNLGFVGYDYQPSKNPKQAERHRLKIMKLNGLLLGRERNKHLRSERRTYDDPDIKTKDKKFDPEGYLVFAKVDEYWTQEVHKSAGHKSPPNLSPHNRRNKWCCPLGTFREETVAEVSALTYATFPAEVEVDPQDHWQCK